MIQKLIDECLAKEQESRSQRVRSGLWSPSLFGRCYRAQYWNRKDEPVTDPPDARVLRIFKAGKLFHDFVQKLITEQHLNIQTEVKVLTEDICGYADIVNDNCVWDIKSIHSKAFWYMDKQDIAVTKFPHILQVMTYAIILKKPNTRLVYISKDDLCIREYGFIVNERWEEEVSNELKKLNEFWANEWLPPAEPRAYKGKECQYCGFKTKCQETKGE